MSDDTPPRRSRRPLSADERALWDSVAKQAKPLRSRKRTIARVVGDPVEPLLPRVAKVQTVTAVISVSAPKPKTKPLAPIERRERVKLSRGQRDIDARIDLHGMTQARAHRALLGFLHRSQAEGCRYVLVVTGKGRGGGETGVLRRMVPEWLTLTEVRTLVVGFEEASPTHGGGGALYVRIRRG